MWTLVLYWISSLFIVVVMATWWTSSVYRYLANSASIAPGKIGVVEASGAEVGDTLKKARPTFWRPVSWLLLQAAGVSIEVRQKAQFDQIGKAMKPGGNLFRQILACRHVNYSAT
jgi:hypothetical protein